MFIGSTAHTSALPSPRDQDCRGGATHIAVATDYVMVEFEADDAQDARVDRVVIGTPNAFAAPASFS